MIKKLIVWIFLLIFFSISNHTEAWRGCCSHHGGQNYCADSGRRVCNDWTYSPSCMCDAPSYSQPIYTYTCPKNSSKDSIGGCTCNIGYIPNENWGCSRDPEIACKNDYPWTYYSYTEKSCVCPWTNIRRWDSEARSCPIEYESCQKTYGVNSIEVGNNKCWCKIGYIMRNKSCVKEESTPLVNQARTQSNYNSNSKEEDSNYWGWLLAILWIWFIIYKNRKN